MNNTHAKTKQPASDIFVQFASTCPLGPHAHCPRVLLLLLSGLVGSYLTLTLPKPGGVVL